MDVLLDTGGIAATALVRDQWHAEARQFARTPGLRLQTTTIVVGEAYTLLRRRSGYELGRRSVRALVTGQTVRVHHVDAAFDRDIWATIDEFAGVPLSYADASLVVLGRRLRIRQAFAFDEDLRACGLELVPGQGEPV